MDEKFGLGILLANILGSQFCLAAFFWLSEPADAHHMMPMVVVSMAHSAGHSRGGRDGADE
jgi:fluoride ion exporter CrcB/FEX